MWHNSRSLPLQVRGLGFNFFLQWRSLSWMGFIQKKQRVISKGCLCISVRKTWLHKANEAKFPMETWFPKANGPKFLMETWFPKTNWPKFPMETWFPKANGPKFPREIWLPKAYAPKFTMEIELPKANRPKVFYTNMVSTCSPKFLKAFFCIRLPMGQNLPL